MSRSRPKRPVAVVAGLGLSLLGSALAWRAFDVTARAERIPVYAPTDGQLVWRASGELRGFVVPADAERWMLEAEQAMQVAMAQSADEPIAVLPFALEPPPLLGADLPPEVATPQPAPTPAPAAEPKPFVDPVPEARDAVRVAESALQDAEEHLRAAQAVQPGLAVELADAEAQALLDREKRDKNQRLFDMGAVSRRVLERYVARAAESEAAANAARQQTVDAAAAVASAEQARDEAADRLALARTDLAKAEATPRPAPPAPADPAPEAPPTSSPIPSAMPQRPEPVAVVVDTEARRYVERRVLLAQAKLAQAEALQKGIPVSVPEGEFIPLLASGSKVVAGQRVGWVWVRR